MLATILPYITIGSAVLMIAAVPLQQRGAGLGAQVSFIRLAVGLTKTYLTQQLCLPSFL